MNEPPPREHLFRAAFDGALDAMLLVDDMGRYVDANAAACSLFGLGRAGLLARQAREFAVPGTDVPAEHDTFMAPGQRRGHMSLVRDDGLRLELEYGTTDNVAPGLHLSVLRDVTQSRRAGEALHASEQSYRQIVDAAREGIWRIDAESKTSFVNRALEEMLGYGPGQMLGRPLFEFMDAEGIALSGSGIERRRKGVSETQETKYIKKDGSVLWAIVHATPLLDASGNYAGALAMVTDNNARRKTEAALRASEEQYRLLFEGSPLPKWLTDVETLRFIAVNDAVCRMLGYSKDELLRMHIGDILPRLDLENVMQVVAATPPDQPLTGTWRHRRKNGSLIDVDIHAQTFTLDGRRARLVIGQDVTGQKQLEAQLMQAQKMEAIGVLAGGVAHDFNNILSVIATYTTFMLDGLRPGDPMRSDLAEVAKASERAMALTRQLLAFSQQQVLQPRIMDLNETIAGIQSLLQRMLGEGIELSFVNGQDLARVNADPGQIEELIMNLVVNARDAMPDGGTLSIETTNVRLDARHAADKPGVAPGSYVMIAVTDTGIGMSEETRARIFEPFFTTKEIGKGTGLGLSTVLGITQQSGGYLLVESELGKGTTFKIQLPCVAGTLTKSDSMPPPVDGLRGTETILVVEDDEQVRRLVRTVLRRNGYRVLDACNAGEAFLICEQEGEPIDLLLTDVVLPKMSGWQLAGRLVPMRPAMKVLFMSGYINDAGVHRRIREANAAFLQKPLTPESLARKVREVLGDVPEWPARLSVEH